MKTVFTCATWIIGGIILVLLVGAGIGFVYSKNNQESKILINNLSVPLNGATAAKIDLNAGSGNLMIDRLSNYENLLASGALQYTENLGVPARTLTTNNGQTTLTLTKSNGAQTGFHLPWTACADDTEWQIHLNPTVPSYVVAYNGGGNVKLDLSGMTITQVMADSGGGNVDLVLPETITNLNVTAKTGAGNVSIELGNAMTGSNTINAKSGAGNVTIKVSNGIVARIHTSVGMGKVVVDTQFNKIDDNTYQSVDYESAANKVEITATSGAGNVTVNTK
jgi:hypothetical protein